MTSSTPHETSFLMLDSAPVGAYWTREDGSFAWVNQFACEMLGYQREELLALDLFSIDAHVTPEFWAQYWAEVTIQESGHLERFHRHRNGSLLLVEVVVRRVINNGEPLHFAFVRDLTEQKHLESLQRKHAQFMTALFRDSPMPQLIIDPGTSEIIDANTAAETFYGYEQIRGRSITSINTLTPEEIQQEMQAAEHRGRHFFRFRHRLASGAVRDVHVYSGPVESDGRMLLHSNIEDMTPLYAFQRELEAHRDQLENLPIGVFKITPGESGVILSVNEAMCQILEADSKEDIIGKKASEFYPDSADREVVSDSVLEKGKVRRLERELVTAKGNQIWVSISLRREQAENGEIFFEGVFENITDRKWAERERLVAYERLHNALHFAPIPIMLHRADGTIEELNAVWCQLTGYRRDEIQTVDDWTHLAYGSRAGDVNEHITRLQSQTGVVNEGDFHIRCKDGSTRIWSFFSSSLESSIRPDSLLISTAIDVTDERERQQQARQSEAIIQSAAEGITITGPDRNIQRVNASFTRITGYTMVEVVGQNPRILSSGRQDSRFYKRMWRQIDQAGHWQGEIWNRRKNGEIYPEWLSISAIHDEKGELTNYAAVFTDLTELKEYQSTLQTLQDFDPLTGLPNKQTLLDSIGDALKAARKKRHGVTLLTCGLDRFHLINETFGHQAGDEILQEIGALLQRVVGNEASVSRIGGDNFALLVAHSDSDAVISDLLSRLRDILARPVLIDQMKTIYLSFSTGIARFPADAQTAFDLLRTAEAAMFKAKRENTGRHVFSDDTKDATRKHYLLEIDLRHAIENDALDVYFQPVVTVADNRIIGAEGLARWNHPEHGPVSPGVFIPIAEEAGIIGPLTDNLLNRAAGLMADLSERSYSPLRLAFNISATQLTHDDFAERILNSLLASGLSPEHFEIELTESTLMQQVDGARAVLDEFRERGASISIDDFGTGFSSLAYLQEIKAHTLKIDKRFIDGCVDNTSSAQLVQSIIAMGQALDMELIAEGVETPEQLELLASLGCDYYQGYLFSKAVPIEQFKELVMKQCR